MPNRFQTSFETKKKCPDDPIARMRTPGCSIKAEKPFEPQTRHSHIPKKPNIPGMNYPAFQAGMTLKFFGLWFKPSRLHLS